MIGRQSICWSRRGTSVTSFCVTQTGLRWHTRWNFACRSWIGIAPGLWASAFEPARSYGKVALVRRAAPEIPEHLLHRAKSGFLIPWSPGLTGLAPTSAGAASKLGPWLGGSEVPWGNSQDDDRPDAGPSRPASAARRGGTVFLMAAAFGQPGGIQTYNRTQVRALSLCEPREPLSVLVSNDQPEDVLRNEWIGHSVSAYGRNKVAFSIQALRRVYGQQPRRVILGHRNLLPLAPQLRFVAPDAERWLLVYGIDAQPRLGPGRAPGTASGRRIFAISPQTASTFEHAGLKRPLELWPCSLPHTWDLTNPGTSLLHQSRPSVDSDTTGPRRRNPGWTCPSGRSVCFARGASALHSRGGWRRGRTFERLREIADSAGVGDVVFFGAG